MKRNVHTTGRAIRRGAVVAVGVAVAISAATTAGAADRSSHGHGHGHVYTISNDPTGNALVVFDRARDGSLTAAPSIPTGGTGTGAGLGSQGAVAVTDNGRYVLAVDPGSDQVSLFVQRGDELTLVESEASGGDLPTSVAVAGHDVYVLNAGVDNNIAGFHIGRDGLDPVPGSIQPLSQPAAGGAQVAFTPDARNVVVTERFTNRIDTFRVRRGVAEPAIVNASNGVTPFGFAFGRRGELLVTNANGGAVDDSSVSSYAIQRDGTLVALAGPTTTNQTAACWLAVSGRFAYAANAGSASVSGFAVDRNGGLQLLSPDGISAAVGAGAIDLDVSDDGRYLYQLSGGDDTIGSFHLENDGTLSSLGVVAGLPPAAAGLTAT